MATGPINFCHPKLNPRITSNKLSIDGHEVTNLVTDSRASGRGFLVESFIRPPVNVSLMFPCNIDIDRIVINGVVGAQRSCSYEIFTFPADRNLVSFNERWDSNYGHVLNKDNYDSHIFTQVGKLFQTSSCDVHGIVSFQNNRFRLRSPYVDLGPMETKLYRQECLVSELRPGRNGRNLSDISHLTIRITQVTRGCVPALKWIEIWGQPSSSCSKTDVNQVLQIYNEIRKSALQNGCNVGEIKDALKSNKQSLKEASARNDIPSDFLDPITCEVMMLPMLLPSGQSIDQSTLEKHNAQEASWGRAPNNPFTGVRFSNISKPVPHAALKLRIDNFLLSEPSITKDHTSQRTLGTARDILFSKESHETQTGSQVVDSAAEKVIISAESRSKPKQTVQSSIPGPSVSLDDALDMLLDDLPSYQVRPYTDSTLRSHVESCPSKANETSLHTESDSKKGSLPFKRSSASTQCVQNKRLKTHGINQNDSNQASNIIDLTCDDESVAKPKTIHEQCISRSLDKALEETLANLPSYQSSRSTSTSIHLNKWRNSSRDCVFCLRNKDVQFVYKLTCGDSTCRDCLTLHKGSSNSIRCKRCGVSSNSKDISKIHF